MEVLTAIRNELAEGGTSERKVKSARFFKEEVKFYGWSNPDVKKLSAKYFGEIKEYGKEKVFEMCEELFSTGYMEEGLIACHWSARMKNQFAPGDFERFEKWVGKYVSNWAICDTFCNHTVGSFMVKYPDHLRNLIQWTQMDNRWLKRGAAVSLVVPARKGEFLDEAFEIASNLLEDKDDLVQKGYGWLLKEESKTHQKEVFEFVMQHKDQMPRTAIRYAIEKMPGDLRKKAMAK